MIWNYRIFCLKIILVDVINFWKKSSDMLLIDGNSTKKKVNFAEFFRPLSCYDASYWENAFQDESILKICFKLNLFLSNSSTFLESWFIDTISVRWKDLYFASCLCFFLFLYIQCLYNWHIGDSSFARS